MITEKHVENQILTYLLHMRIFAWKNQSTGVFDPSKGAFRKSRNPHHIKGVSDVLGIFEGRFLAIEIKRPYISKKTLKVKHRTQEELEKLASDEQKQFIKKIQDNGGVAFYADSLEVVKEQLTLYASKAYVPTASGILATQVLQ